MCLLTWVFVAIKANGSYVEWICQYSMRMAFGEWSTFTSYQPKLCILYEIHISSGLHGVLDILPAHLPHS